MALKNVDGLGIMVFSSTDDYRDSGKFASIKKELELIAESIHRILNTTPGERPRNPQFGCEIKRVIFEQNDFVTQRVGTFMIQEAITKFEPRVELLDTQLTPDYASNRLQIKLFFRVKQQHEQQYALTSTINI